MNTKSKIQLLTEQIESQNKTFERLQSIIEQYDVNQVVLDKNLNQITSGYLVPGQEFTDLKEAVKNWDKDQVIWFNDNKFVICQHHDSLLEFNSEEGQICVPTYEIHY